MKQLGMMMIPLYLLLLSTIFAFNAVTGEEVKIVSEQINALKNKIEMQEAVAVKAVEEIKKQGNAVGTVNDIGNAELDILQVDFEKSNLKRKVFASVSEFNKTGSDKLGDEIAEKKFKKGFVDADMKSYTDFLGEKASAFETKLKRVSDTIELVKKCNEWMKETIQLLNAVYPKPNEVKRLDQDLGLLMKQAMLQQFFTSEKVRSDGVSGIKQVPTSKTGGNNFDSASADPAGGGKIYDLETTERRLGMGQFTAVLNGVTFRTTKNDYELVKPAKTKEYEGTELIEFPSVPNTVLEKSDIGEQVEEMKEYFKAFHNQDSAHRNYKAHFPAVISYLEGSWIKVNKDGKEEGPIQSDQLNIEWAKWEELQRKTMYAAYTGLYRGAEDIPFLPMTIMSITEDHKPVFAQWHYRIMCHPLINNIPTTLLKPVYDESSLKYSGHEDKCPNFMTTRFKFENVIIKKIKNKTPKIFFDGLKPSTNQLKYTILDHLMGEIPGIENYGGKINDKGFDAGLLSASPFKQNKILNAAYYNRAYVLNGTDAMGNNGAQRGFSDFLFVARTDNEKVAEVSCRVEEKRTKTTRTVSARVSYAMPLEIIYLTPLSRWNPYNIETTQPFARTPALFFQQPINSIQDEGKEVVGSGLRTLLPKIEGIEGNIRIRYPIMPLHFEGSPVSKSLNALKDSTDFKSAKKKDYDYYYTSYAKIGQDLHRHEVEISIDDIRRLKAGEISDILVDTSRAHNHGHQLKMVYNNDRLVVSECNKEPADNGFVCFDKHRTDLVEKDSC